MTMDYEQGRRDLQQMINKFQETEDGRQKLQNWINHFNNPNIGKRTGKLVPFTTNLDELFPSSDSSDNESTDAPTPVNQPPVTKPREGLPEPEFPSSNDNTPRVEQELVKSNSAVKLTLDGTRDGSFTGNHIPSGWPTESPLLKSKGIKKRLFGSSTGATRRNKKSLTNNTTVDSRANESQTVADDTNTVPSPRVDFPVQSPPTVKRKSRAPANVTKELEREKSTSVTGSRRKSKKQVKPNKKIEKSVSPPPEMTNKSKSISLDKNTKYLNAEQPPPPNNVPQADESDVDDFFEDDFIVESITKEESARFRSHKVDDKQPKSPPTAKRKTMKRADVTKVQEKQDTSRATGGRRKSKKQDQPKAREKSVSPPPKTWKRMDRADAAPDADISPADVSLSKRLLKDRGKYDHSKDFEEAAQFTVEPLTPQEKESIRKMGKKFGRSSALGSRTADDSTTAAHKNNNFNKSKSQHQKQAPPDNNTLPTALPTQLQRKSRRKRKILDDSDEVDAHLDDNATSVGITNDNNGTIEGINHSLVEKSQQGGSESSVNKYTKKGTRRAGRKATKRFVAPDKNDTNAAPAEPTVASPTKRLRLRSRSHDKTNSSKTSAVNADNSRESLHQWLSTTSNDVSHLTKQRIPVDTDIQNGQVKHRRRGRSKKVQKETSNIEHPSSKVATPSSKFDPFKEPFVDNRNLAASGPIKRRTTYDSKNNNKLIRDVPNVMDEEGSHEHVAFPLVDQSSIVNPHESHLPKSRLMGPPASTPRRARTTKAADDVKPDELVEDIETIISESDSSLGNNNDTYADNQALVLDAFDENGDDDSHNEEAENQTKTNSKVPKAHRSKVSKGNRQKDGSDVKENIAETKKHREKEQSKNKSNRKKKPSRNTESLENHKTEEDNAEENNMKSKKTKRTIGTKGETKKHKNKESNEENNVRIKKSKKMISEDSSNVETDQRVKNNKNSHLPAFEKKKGKKNQKKNRNRNSFYAVVPNELVIPSDTNPTPGVRRSRRVRTKPLHRWLGEEFEYDEEGNIVGIHPPEIPLKQTYTDAGKKLKPKPSTKNNLPKPKKQSKDLNLPSENQNTTEKDQTHDESRATELLRTNLESSIRSEDGVGDPIKLTTANQLNTTTYSVIDQSHVVDVGANKLISVPENEVPFQDQVVEGVEKLTYTKGLTNKAVAMGTVTIPPGQQKGLSCMHHMLCFHLMKGVVEVLLCDNWSVLGQGSYFIVPGGNGYDIRNTSKSKEAVLVFTQVKAKSQGLVFQ